MDQEVVSPFVVVSSPGMHEIAARVVSLIGQSREVYLPHHHVVCERFANGELLPSLSDTVRRQHVFFFHALQHPSPNEAIMSLLLALDALKRASAAGVTLVVPYIPYLRQDRKHAPRVSISARLIADLIESVGCVERIITADMHADQAQGFFAIPVDNLTTVGLFANYFREKCVDDLADVVVVSPDFGGAVRARRFAQKLGEVPVAIFEKRRPRANVSEIVSVIGESVCDKVVIIYDDMIDTGGTIRGVVSSLKKLGAREVHVCATHGIFSGTADSNFAAAGFPVVCTDSIPRPESFHAAHAEWLSTISMSNLLAEAVYQASLVGGSVSRVHA